jgi:sugar phosphate permease
MVDFAPQVAVSTDAAAARPSARRYYVLGLLTVVYALNFLDRTIFNVLIEPIKKEFVLSDTTMGLLAGFGFVLFYSLLGIPIARVADRLNRRNIVRDRVCVLERDDVPVRHGLERRDAGLGADRRRHR